MLSASGGAHAQRLTQGSGLRPSLHPSAEAPLWLWRMSSRPHPVPLCPEFITGAARLEECCGYGSLTVT